jgi:uncharacterized membrane protein YhhN
MTTVAWAWLVVVAVTAVLDWLAVALDRRRLEYVTKPTVMVGLIGLTLGLTAGSPASDAARPWFLAGLALALVGDVLLMLPRERFIGGLVAFLLAHVAYIVGLLSVVRTAGLVIGGLMVGLVVVGTMVALVARPIVRAVRIGRPSLTLPVVAYLAVISTMVLVTFVTGRPAAMAGATLFYASDAILAWDRFVVPLRFGRLATHVSYHAAQMLLVLSLLG